MKILHLLVFLILIIGLALGCGAPAKPPETQPTASVPPPDVSLLAPEQITSIILTYGVPHLNYYMQENGWELLTGTFNATGVWTAIYEGNKHWRVQGAISRTYRGFSTDCSSTWIYIQDAKEIYLTRISCN